MNKNACRQCDSESFESVAQASTPRARSLLCLLIGSCAYFGFAHRAVGQAQLADEIVVISKGLRAQESARDSTHLGESPGAGGNRLRVVPGGGAPLLGRPAGGTPIARHDVLSAAAAPPGGISARPEPVMAPPASLMPAQLPQYGFLELPTEEEEGPPNGLTLDMAIDRLVRANYDLRTKFQEIPKADADILSAGLRGNPLVFASANDVAYGGYSPQRPGDNNYGVTVIQPFDVNRKRDMRVVVAQRAKRVLEAQYQDAVRLEIDNLYTAFVDVLAAREAVRYLETSVHGFDEIIEVTKHQLEGRQIPVMTLDRLAVQRESVALALDEAKTSHSKAAQVLAMLLSLPVADGNRLVVRGKLLMSHQELPPLDDLIGIAWANRPDLMAFRLGVQRARADVGLAEREGFPDVFVLYTPWGLRNNAPTGGQNVTSWGLGAMASVPLFNRNQGNVRRARINVAQTRTELGGLERQVETEVRTAYRDYETTRSVAQRLENNVLPRAKSIRDQTFKLFKVGEVSAIEYLNSQREYSEIIRQYRDALIKQRRASLHLNTAIALRLIL